jgi:DNA-binding response OmpR family regulator
VTTILVVDDDGDIRQLVADLLRLSGFEAVTAPSGVAALEQLAVADELPSLALLDVQMPELDGWDTLRSIRRDPRTADLPVVLCTVKSGAADTAVGWSLGCDGYVVKPFAITDLIEEVETVLHADRDARLLRRRQAVRDLDAAGA